MGAMNELPRRAVIRTAKLAALPLGFAGRTTIGLGKRIGGRPAEIVAAEVQARTAEQLFKVLGELKGGAMKFGQAMSVFEAALPENLAGPYRETLTRLQESAPPLPASTVHAVLAREPADWHAVRSFRTSPPRPRRSPGAPGGLGRRRKVAVKVQYPGAGQALLSAS
jgi:predicted unusual protein kinase regulating ubiquinone biosynthesis (AarF/ABC1/UbiB family)